MVGQLTKTFIKARPGKIWPRLVAYLLFEGRPLTTRARWLNPLIFGLFRLLALLPKHRHNPQPIFIFGVGRSGTTILGSILALHRNVGYLNEPKALWQAALGDDDLIGSYSRKPGRYRMSCSDATQIKSRRLQQFYGAYQTLSGTSRVVDKYPELIFRVGLIDVVFPCARKIVLVRNGQDICQSINRWSQFHAKSNGTNTEDWWGRNQRKWLLLLDDVVSQDPIFAAALPQIRAFTRHTDMAAVEWIATMREVARVQSSRPDSLHIVRYEDLIVSPSQTLQEILRFCALPVDPVMLAYGTKILSRQTSRSPLQLHPAIHPAFDITMQALGYRYRQAA